MHHFFEGIGVRDLNAHNYHTSLESQTVLIILKTAESPKSTASVPVNIRTLK